jgi:hypothetical protein
VSPRTSYRRFEAISECRPVIPEMPGGVCTPDELMRIAGAMDALIDKAGVAFIHILIIPNRREQGGERRLAPGILVAARQRPEHSRHGLEVLFVYSCDELRLGKRHTWDVVVDRWVFFDLATTKP